MSTDSSYRVSSLRFNNWDRASNDPTAVMNFLIDFDSRGVLVELQSRSACQQAAREQPELGSSETHQEPTRPHLADASPLRREPCQPARVLRRTSRTSAEDDKPAIFPVLRQESWCVGMSCTWFSVPNCRATPDNRNGSQWTCTCRGREKVDTCSFVSSNHASGAPAATTPAA